MDITKDVFEEICEEISQKLDRCKTKEDIEREFPSAKETDPDYWIYKFFDDMDKFATGYYGDK